MRESGKGIATVALVLALVSVGLGGFIVYKEFFVNPNSSNYTTSTSFYLSSKYTNPINIWVDMDELDITVNVASGDVHILYTSQVQLYFESVGFESYFSAEITVDGTPKTNSYKVIVVIGTGGDINEHYSFSLQYVVSGLDSSNHVIGLQIRGAHINNYASDQVLSASYNSV